MRSKLSSARKLSLATACSLALIAGTLCVQTAQAAPFEPGYVGLVTVGSDVYATSIDAAGDRHERITRVGSVADKPTIAKVGDTWYVTTGVGTTARTVHRVNIGHRSLQNVTTLPATRLLVDGSGATPFTVAAEDPTVDIEHAEAKALRASTFASYADTPINAVATRASAHGTTLCVGSHEGRKRVLTFTLGQSKAQTYLLPKGMAVETLACTEQGPLVAAGNARMDAHSAGASTLPTINVTKVGALRSVQTYGRAQQVAAQGKGIFVASAYDGYALIASVEETGRIIWSHTLPGVTTVTALRSTGDGALVAAGNTLYRIHNIARKVEMVNLDGEILALA